MRENYTLARLYVDMPLEAGGEISLSPEHSHYLGNVLRRSAGDGLRLFNEKNGEWAAEIITIKKKHCTVRIIERLRKPYATPDIWLLFAPVRKHRNAFILEKATELGVAQLQPVITARTQFSKIRLDKMRAQIIEAAEQTERLDLPELHETLPLVQLLQDWDGTRQIIFADEGGACEAALSVLQSLEKPAALLIGPEGGFTEKERELLHAQDFVTPVSLGPRILRADTAALSLLTLYQAVKGDWRD